MVILKTATEERAYNVSPEVAHALLTQEEGDTEARMAGYEASMKDKHVYSVATKATLEHETDPDFLCPICFHHHEEGSTHLD